jgi:hypothetical protein
MTTELHRKAVILIVGGSDRCVHALITSSETAAGQASQEGDNAEERVKLLKKLSVYTQIKDNVAILSLTRLERTSENYQEILNRLSIRLEQTTAEQKQ